MTALSAQPEAPEPLSALSGDDELDGLDPLDTPVTLNSGVQVYIVALRARQFFKFLRILTHGAMPAVGDTSVFKLDPDGDPQQFATRLLSLLMLSIPDAEDETVVFIRSMVKPLGLIEPARTKQDTATNNARWDEVDVELFNPDLHDLVSIIERIVEREAADIQALGKRLSQLFKLAQKTGQLTSPKRAHRIGNSSADSPGRSTSSPASTAGTTSSSGSSPSDGFDNA